MTNSVQLLPASLRQVYFIATERSVEQMYQVGLQQHKFHWIQAGYIYSVMVQNWFAQGGQVH
jgi:hypothetical protein